MVIKHTTLLVVVLSERTGLKEGIWYSDDLYGPHDREWVKVSETLVGTGTSALVVVKVKGDVNVPSRYQTWRTKILPDVGGSSVPTEIQIRTDVKDPNGFSWMTGFLVLLSEDMINLTVIWSNTVTRGTFHKHKVGEDS